MKNLLSILVILALFASCQQKEEFPDSENAGSEMRFDTSEAKWEYTRGADITADNINSMAVFGYHTDATWAAVLTAGNIALPMIFNNQAVVRDVSVPGSPGPWTYAPLEYWHAVKKHHFFAFSPYGAGIIATPTNDAPRITYEVPAKALHNIDLLWSTGSTLDMTYAANGSSAVNFTFKHALTKITFAARNTDAYAAALAEKNEEVKIILIELQNLYTQGTSRFVYNNDQTAITGGEWIIDGNHKYYDFSAQEDSTNHPGALIEDKWLTTTMSPVCRADSGAFYMLPQTISPAPDPDNMPIVDIYFQHKNSGKIVHLEKPLPAPSSGKWEPGVHIQYQVTYDGNGISPYQLEAVILPWNTQEVNGDLQGTYLNVSETKLVIPEGSSYTMYYHTDYSGAITVDSTIPYTISNNTIIFTPVIGSTGSYTAVVKAGKLLSRKIKITVIAS